MQTIDDVIKKLDIITKDSIADINSIGYFSALYYQVTLQVRFHLQENYFDNNERMEKLVIVFAERYFDALDSYLNNRSTSRSWRASFDLIDNYWPTVLQHLIVGMNAHINLDLGIAAAQIGKDNMKDLKGDFFKINDVLASLLDKVENDYAQIWPILKVLLKWSRRGDDFLINFSMKLARNGAWKFAEEVAVKPKSQIKILIKKRDQKVFRVSRLITKPGLFVSILFIIMRIGEKGDIPFKINKLLD